jgi:Response regulator containing CheY-like receiver domain and AraC-type DNA-binding domain
MKRKQTLIRWIFLSCMVLLIPISCAIINFFINKKLVERKIDQVNIFIAKNIQYNIDNRFETLLDVSKYYLLDSNFYMTSLNTKDESTFLERIRNCYKSLEVMGKANPRIEAMIYIPEHEYILGSRTANGIDQIHKSLQINRGTELSLEAWKETLMSDYEGKFLISSELGYTNFGKESMIYLTPLLYSNANNNSYGFLSTSTDFISEILEEEANRGNTVLILDGKHNIIGQFGEELLLDSVQIFPKRDVEELVIQGERYIVSTTMSEIADWSYVILTPKSIYMQEVHANRNINLLIVFLGALVGMLAVAFIQRKHYRSAKQIMDILPIEQNTYDEDEFVTLGTSLRKLYADKLAMQNQAERRKEYDKEVTLLSVIQKNYNFFQRLNSEELLGAGWENKLYSFMTLRLDGDNRDEDSIDRELFIFSINNILTEVFEDSCNFVRTVDEDLLVYLFILNKEKKSIWPKYLKDKFIWINEFLLNYLNAEYSITVGDIFASFEIAGSEYARIQEASAQRYFTVPYGVMAVSELNEGDFLSGRQLNFYTKRFEEVITAADFYNGQKLGKELFHKLELSGNTYNIIYSSILSIINEIWLYSHEMIQSRMINEEILESALEHIRKSESVEELETAFFCFLKIICRNMDTNKQESDGIAEDIKRYVQANYTDCNMNISAIADSIGMTPRYMSKLFKEQVGENLLDFINDVRIERAKVLIGTTNKTIEEIAEETGFANVRTFRRNFIKVTGVTAGKYKN